MAIETDKNGQPLSLPFDPEQTSPVRMRPAEIARLFQVSPARVSQWIKNGQITRFADGLIDPARAARELAKNCDIRRMRAKPFRPLSDEVQKLRGQLATAAQENEDMTHQLTSDRRRLVIALERYAIEAAWLSRFADVLEALTPDQRTGDAGAWRTLLDQLFDDAGKAAEAMDKTEALRMADTELSAWLQVPETAEAVTQDPPLEDADTLPPDLKQEIEEAAKAFEALDLEAPDLGTDE